MASILVSEADPDVRRLLAVLVERQGHEAVVLRDDVVVPPRGDLLLVEPRSASGTEHARLLRAFFPGLPVVCLSPLPADTGFLGRGPTFFLPKPFDPAQLDAVLDRALGPLVSAA